MKERNTVDVVQEEDSSSQNVNITVTGIYTKGAFIEVSLSTGASFFISDSDFLEYSFSKGDAISSGTAEKLEKGDRFIRCRSKALELLSLSEHTAYLLRGKLLQRDYDSETVKEVIAFLSEKKYLDDSRYAELWLKSRLRKNPAGKSVLTAALISRGVSRETAERAVSGILDEETLMAGARLAYRKAASKKNITKEKIVANLLKKGYSMSVIRSMDEEAQED